MELKKKVFALKNFIEGIMSGENVNKKQLETIYDKVKELMLLVDEEYDDEYDDEYEDEFQDSIAEEKLRQFHRNKCLHRLPLTICHFN